MSWPGQAVALEALRQAVLVADVDVWRRHLPGGPLGFLASHRIKRALSAGADRIGLQIEVSDPIQLQLGDEVDPIGAKVALLQAAWLVAAGQSESVGRPSLAAVLMTEAGTSATIARRAELAAVYWNAQRHRESRSRAPIYLIGAALLVLVLAGFFLARTPPPEPPPPTDTTHLAPDREAAWIEAISDWVVAVDRHARLAADGALSGPLREAEEQVEAHHQAILAEPLPPAVLDAARHALSAARAATQAGSDWETREGAFAEATRLFNRALREAGLGYFFDAYAALYPGRGEVGLFSFRVDAIGRYRQTGNPGSPIVDALHLRRIDKLNLVQFLLGYTSRRMDVAVVLLDKLEHQLATRLGPALVPQAMMPLRLEGDAFSDWAAVKTRAGQLVREAFYAAFPDDRQALTELGELLAKRDALFTGWNEKLGRRNISLRVPEQLEITTDYLDQVGRLLGGAARSELEDLQERLTVQSNRRVFTRLLLRHASSVERHEVQHRLDYADPDFKPPSALLSAMGLEDADEEVIKRRADRASAELSAYTAELARDAQWVMVNLSLLAEHLYDGSGGAEGWSAILILEGLAELTGFYAAPDAPPRLTDSLPIDAADVATVHLRLMAQRPDALAQAAATLWERWYGRPLASIVREDASP